MAGPATTALALAGLALLLGSSGSRPDSRRHLASSASVHQAIRPESPHQESPHPASSGLRPESPHQVSPHQGPTGESLLSAGAGKYHRQQGIGDSDFMMTLVLISALAAGVLFFGLATHGPSGWFGRASGGLLIALLAGCPEHGMANKEDAQNFARKVLGEDVRDWAENSIYLVILGSAFAAGCLTIGHIFANTTDHTSCARQTVVRITLGLVCGGVAALEGIALNLLWVGLVGHFTDAKADVGVFQQALVLMIVVGGIIWGFWFGVISEDEDED